MGSSSSRHDHRRVSFSNVDHLLEYLRAHCGDLVLCNGLMQEITHQCTNPAQHAKFFDVMITQKQWDGYEPFAEVFHRGRLATSPNLKSQVVKWIRLALDINETEAVPKMLQCGLLSFLLDFYEFQASSPVPFQAVIGAAILLSRCSKNATFVRELIESGAYEPILTRLRYATTGAECDAIIEALLIVSRVHEGALMLAKQDTLQQIMKVILVSQKAPQRLCNCLDILCEIISCNHNLRLSRGPNLSLVLRSFEHEDAVVYRPMARLVCLLLELNPTDDVKNEVRKAAPSLLFTSFFDTNEVAVEHALHLSLYATNSSESKMAFVRNHRAGSSPSSSSSRFSTVTSRVKRRYVEQAVSHWLVLVDSLSSDTQFADDVVASGAFEVLLWIFDRSSSEQLASLKCMRKLCWCAAAAAKLLGQPKFSVVPRHVVSAQGAIGNITLALEILRLLQEIFLPCVLCCVDFAITEAIQSLLCELLGCSSTASTTTALTLGHVSATRVVSVSDAQSLSEIIRIALQLLCSRCQEIDVAASVLAQLPVDRLRVLQTHTDADIAARSKELVSKIAASSFCALIELQMLGLVGMPSGAGQRNKVTIRMLQRRWRKERRLREIGRMRQIAAALFKDYCLKYGELVFSEHSEFEYLAADIMRQRSQLGADVAFRVKFVRAVVGNTEGLFSEENCEWNVMMRLALIDVESAERILHSRSFQQFRSLCSIIFFESREEIAARCRISALQCAEFSAMLRRNKQSIGVIDRCYEYRRSLAIDEVNSRNIIKMSQLDGHTNNRNRHIKLHLQHEECVHRREVVGSWYNEWSDLAATFYPMLFTAFTQSEHSRRCSIESRLSVALRDSHHRVVCLRQVAEEELSRSELLLWEGRVRSEACTSAVRHMLLLLCAEERCARCSLSRKLCVKWKAARQQWPALNLNNEEICARHDVEHGARMGIGFLHEGLRATLPLVCEGDELAHRHEIEKEFSQFVDRSLLQCSMLRLQHTERLNRNAIALQSYFTARDAIVPLSCIVIHYLLKELFGKVVLCRSDIAVTEATRRLELAVSMLRHAELLSRRRIVAEEKCRARRFMEKFSLLSLAMRLQAAAFAAKYIPHQ